MAQYQLVVATILGSMLSLIASPALAEKVTPLMTQDLADLARKKA
jgi:hypothetical protein